MTGLEVIGGLAAASAGSFSGAAAGNLLEGAVGGGSGMTLKDAYGQIASAITAAGNTGAAAAINAANISSQSIDRALNTLTTQYALARQDLQPYNQFGLNAMGTYQALMGINAPLNTSAPSAPNQSPTTYNISNTLLTGTDPGNTYDYTTNNSPITAFGSGTGTGSFNPNVFGSSPQVPQPQYSNVTGTPQTVGANGSLTTMSPEQVLQNWPGYKWAFQQGQEALQTSANAAGFLNSGEFAKDMVKYGQGLASQTFNTYTQDLLNQIQVGESAAAGQSSLAKQQGDNAGQLQVAQGTNVANAQMSSANLLANALVASTQTRYQYLTGQGGGGG